LMLMGNLHALTAERKNPLPYKYLSIRYVDSTYQYDKAIEEIKVYVKLKPDDLFGRNFLGYLYFCKKNYKQAIKEFKKAIRLKKRQLLRLLQTITMLWSPASQRILGRCLFTGQ